MQIDLCALTEDLLPLYADDLLSPATRQLLEQHAAACPACRERLRAAGIQHPPPAPTDLPRLERPARAFFRRLSRLLYAGLAAVVALLVATGSLGYVAGRQSLHDRQRIPQRVAGAEELARQAIPGWDRATAHGLVMDVGVTERIPRTDAAITVEKAWFSSRQVYVLYTVTAPEDRYWFPVEALLRDDNPDRILDDGRTPWNRLADWGGVSPEGFHSVLIFNRVEPYPGRSRLRLVLRQWMRLDPRSGPQHLGTDNTFWEDLEILLPWNEAYLAEPPPEVIPWRHQHTWLGRTLALDALEVGVGETRLTGTISLPAGERDPRLYATLVIGNQELEGGYYALEPAGEPGRYRFTLSYDGPDRWPAPVELRLHAIDFVTDQVLEWPVNWAKYREPAPADDRPMDPEDQVSLPFYDSELVSTHADDSGVAIEQRTPKRKPPYVKSSLHMGGRGIPPDLGPGFEIVNDDGEVMTNLGGFGGLVYEGPDGKDVRERVAAIWWDELPESFRRSERLIVRYVHPSATLVLDETWTLPVRE